MLDLVKSISSLSFSVAELTECFVVFISPETIWFSWISPNKWKKQTFVDFINRWKKNSLGFSSHFLCLRSFFLLMIYPMKTFSEGETKISLCFRSSSSKVDSLVVVLYLSFSQAFSSSFNSFETHLFWLGTKKTRKIRHV